MILLLLFSISSTIRASNAQTKITNIGLCACAETDGRIYYKNAAENYKKKIADFLVGLRYGKWCKFLRNVV